MITASWNGRIIAQSDTCEKVEGNFYFPKQSVEQAFLRPSSTHTTCGWKGVASYYTLEVDGKTNEDAAWFYPEPKDGAKQVKDRVAFWRGVVVREG